LSTKATNVSKRRLSASENSVLQDKHWEENLGRPSGAVVEEGSGGHRWKHNGAKSQDEKGERLSQKKREWSEEVVLSKKLKPGIVNRANRTSKKEER